jgi:hypothetical protein
MRVLLIFLLLLICPCRADVMSEFTDNWLYDGECDYDFSGDNKVNFKDFAILTWVLTQAAAGAGYEFVNGGNISSAIAQSSNCKLVYPSDNLQAAYDWLKSSGRDATMGALSATNRRTLVLSPGAYQVTATLVLDTDYVDIVALAPAPGKNRISTDYEWSGTADAGTPVTTAFCPPPTYIYGDLHSTAMAAIATGALQGAVVEQRCNDIRLSGFGICNTNNPGESDIDSNTDADIGASALCITATDNSPSVYRQMYFWLTGPGVWHTSPTGWCRLTVFAYSSKVFGGLWVDCQGNGWSYRTGSAAVFKAHMYRCIGGTFSFIGDASDATVSGCKLYDCEGIGYFNQSYQGSTTSGYGCFSGCRSFSNSIDAASEFVRCVAGDNSFGVGNATVAGTFIDCRGGDNCFAGTRLPDNGTYQPTFSGTAIRCTAGGASFGAGNLTAKCSGTLIDCRNDTLDATMRLEGAKIRNSRFKADPATTNMNIFVLIDGLSKVYNTTALVEQGGSGLPFASNGSAQNITAALCIMNNATNDNDGLGADVTNLVTGGNVVDDDIN